MLGGRGGYIYEWDPVVRRWIVRRALASRENDIVWMSVDSDPGGLVA